MVRMRNDGIYQSGGKINADQIVVGHYARAEKIVKVAKRALEEKGLADISQKLQELTESVKENISQLEMKEEMLDATEQVAEGLTQEKPNKLTLTALLNGIEMSAGSVTAVVSAANALKSLVTNLL